MTARPLRTLVGTALVLACALTVVVLATPRPAAGPALEPAADLSQFKAGNIITDAVFHDSDSMTAAQIQSFLALRAGLPAVRRGRTASRTSS